MARQFLTITQDEIDERVAEAIRARELELLSYDIEQAGHEATIAALADVRDTPELQALRGLDRNSLIVAAKSQQLSDETLTSAALLNQRARSEIELAAVKIEIARSEQHLANFLAQLPEEGGRRAKAIAAMQAKQATKE